MEGEADHDVDFEIDPNHIQLLGGTILIDPVLIFPQVQTKPFRDNASENWAPHSI